MDKSIKTNIYKEKCYTAPQGEPTIFSYNERNVFLKSLFGISCGFSGEDSGASRTRGLVSIYADMKVFDASNLLLQNLVFTGESITIIWQNCDESIRVESSWKFCDKTGVWSRKDKIVNISGREITISNYMAKFVFSPGQYDLYSQRGVWCGENQGAWQRLHHGTFELSCEGARTCQGSTPYLCIRNSNDLNAAEGIAFHILPVGNWVIRANAYTCPGNSLPHAVIELGQSDKYLQLQLAPGDIMESPEVLIHGIAQGCPEAGAEVFQKYLLTNLFRDSKKIAPVVYNTWFDDFDFLDVSRLRKQLAAVKSIGCEVFTVDAGWYGAGDGNWSSQTGDWRENKDKAFKGRMFEFSEEVRSEGLGFGLWMEPERFGAQVSIVKAHPEWFLEGGSGFYYPDIENPEAYNYILNEIKRLICTYNLAWIKIDFNFELVVDPTGKEFLGYYNSWYRLLDEIRRTYPEVFIEGCASGGMRLDINTLRHNDTHFLSDSENPTDSLRIYQGALLRLPGGRLSKWAVVRPAGTDIPSYGTPLLSSPAKLLSPGGATWDTSITADVDFTSAVALTGVYGLSGDIWGISQDDRNCLERHISFYKKWRGFIMNSIVHMLTPVCPKEDRSGWVGFQLYNLEEKDILLFIYRLEDAEVRKRFKLQKINPDTRYEITYQNSPDIKPVVYEGVRLLSEGIWIELPKRNSAAVIVISPV